MSGLENLTAKKFDKLTILKRVENFEGLSDVRVQYLVECDCGNISKMTARAIKRRKYKMCETCRLEEMPVQGGSRSPYSYHVKTISSGKE